MNPIVGKGFNKIWDGYDNRGQAGGGSDATRRWMFLMRVIRETASKDDAAQIQPPEPFIQQGKPQPYKYGTFGVENGVPYFRLEIGGNLFQAARYANIDGHDVLSLTYADRTRKEPTIDTLRVQMRLIALDLANNVTATLFTPDGRGHTTLKVFKLIDHISSSTKLTSIRFDFDIEAIEQLDAQGYFD